MIKRGRVTQVASPGLVDERKHDCLARHEAEATKQKMQEALEALQQEVVLLKRTNVSATLVRKHDAVELSQSAGSKLIARNGHAPGR
jgi:hypothetical protein